MDTNTNININNVYHARYIVYTIYIYDRYYTVKVAKSSRFHPMRTRKLQFISQRQD